MIDWRHWHNEPFLTGGLILAGGTMWALLKLFGAEASKPLDAAMIDPPAAVLRVA